MSYTATNWQNGDIITAAKLNKAEQGVANMLCVYFVVNVDVDTTNAEPVYTPDMTYAEVIAEINRGRVPIYNFAHDGVNMIFVANNLIGGRILIGKKSALVFYHGENGIYADGR